MRQEGTYGPKLHDRFIKGEGKAPDRGRGRGNQGHSRGPGNGKGKHKGKAKGKDKGKSASPAASRSSTPPPAVYTPPARGKGHKLSDFLALPRPIIVAGSAHASPVPYSYTTARHAIVAGPAILLSSLHHLSLRTPNGPACHCGRSRLLPPPTPSSPQCNTQVGTRKQFLWQGTWQLWPLVFWQRNWSAYDTLMLFFARCCLGKVPSVLHCCRFRLHLTSSLHHQGPACHCGSRPTLLTSLPFLHPPLHHYHLGPACHCGRSPWFHPAHADPTLSLTTSTPPHLLSFLLVATPRRRPLWEIQ